MLTKYKLYALYLASKQSQNNTEDMTLLSSGERSCKQVNSSGLLGIVTVIFNIFKMYWEHMM